MLDSFISNFVNICRNNHFVNHMIVKVENKITQQENTLIWIASRFPRNLVDSEQIQETKQSYNADERCKDTQANSAKQ